MRTHLRLPLLLIAAMTSTCAFALDPTGGATAFVMAPAGQLWHPIGPAKEITRWLGPFGNGSGHPAKIYMFTARVGRGDSVPAAGSSGNLQIIHTLGTSFYYPSGKQPEVDPATLGYTAAGFDTADKLISAFPSIGTLFPQGLRASGCHVSNGEFYFIKDSGSEATFLIVWLPQRHQVANIAYMPANLLTGSLESVLDNFAYYELGGAVEIARFSALMYYLSRVGADTGILDKTASASCPDTPTMTAHGLEVPKGWIESLQGLDPRK